MYNGEKVEEIVVKNIENSSKENLSKMQKFKTFLNKYYWYIFGIGVAIFAFLCFFNLGKLPIQDWDEARHGINAYEMLRHNSIFANYFQDEFDYWNLKPPVSYWGVMLGYKIFGYNTFGMRFFSAFSLSVIYIPPLNWVGAFLPPLRLDSFEIGFSLFLKSFDFSVCN